MHLFLTEVSKIIIQTVACSIPFGLQQRTDTEKWTNFSREESHHRQPSVGIKVLWLTAYLQHNICTEGREKWDGPGLHTRRTSLALDMSRAVSVLYLKLVLHPVDRKDDGQSEKTVLPSFLD